jgi:hypothetical protein
MFIGSRCRSFGFHNLGEYGPRGKCDWLIKVIKKYHKKSFQTQLLNRTEHYNW